MGAIRILRGRRKTLIMNKIKQWVYRYNAEITWFIIGWLGLTTVHDFGRGDWINVFIDLFLIAINYSFYRK